MGPKPKGGLLALALGPKPSMDDEEASEDEGDDGDTSAAQAVLDAIDASDPKALKAALKLCYEEK